LLNIITHNKSDAFRHGDHEPSPLIGPYIYDRIDPTLIEACVTHCFRNLVEAPGCDIKALQAAQYVMEGYIVARSLQIAIRRIGKILHTHILASHHLSPCRIQDLIRRNLALKVRMNQGFPLKSLAAKKELAFSEVQDIRLVQRQKA
jgi:hypothetical protein